jgi:hypothetical protein
MNSRQILSSAFLIFGIANRSVFRRQLLATHGRAGRLLRVSWTYSGETQERQQADCQWRGRHAQIAARGLNYHHSSHTGRIADCPR